MPQEPVTPLTKEEVDFRVRRLEEEIRIAESRGENGCTGLAVSIAEALADPGSNILPRPNETAEERRSREAVELQNRNAGAMNVYSAYPQLFVAPEGRPNSRVYDPRLDLDRDGTLEVHEATAAVLAAATLRAHGVSLADIQVNDEFIALARAKCEDVQKTTCAVPGL